MNKDCLLKDLEDIRIQLKELNEYLPFVTQTQMVDAIDFTVYQIITKIKQHEKTKFKKDDIKNMVWSYQLCGRNIKKTLYKLECEGLHISDKQLRNILEKQGVYKRKK